VVYAFRRHDSAYNDTHPVSLTGQKKTNNNDKQEIGKPTYTDRLGQGTQPGRPPPFESSQSRASGGGPLEGCGLWERVEATGDDLSSR
jgi:hypothetical protein